jgi:hypothetical protein
MTRYTPLWLQSGSYAGSQDRRLLGALWPAAASSGCAVSPGTAAMTVNVAPGSVAVPSQNNTGSTLCASDAQEVVGPLAAAPPSGQSRIDRIICRPRGTDLDGGANNDFIFDFLTGTPATSPAQPTPPAVPAGTATLARILIPGASATIAPANITDERPAGLGVPNPSRAGGPIYHSEYARNAAYNFTATTSLLVFDTVIDDVAGLYNPTTGLYTCPAAGFYQGVAGLAATMAASSSCDVRLQKNGAVLRVLGGMVGNAAVSGKINANTGPIRCAAGDTLAWMIFASVTLAGSPNPANTWMSFDYLGPGI